MQTWKLTLEYEGTRYSGWQEQANARTVQGELRKAATALFEREVELGGAGRTDAGVHALAQVAHLKLRRNPGDAKSKLAPKKILNGLNDQLPPDINILGVDEVDPRFHARHDATSRTYLYRISTRRTAFEKRLVWWVKDPLDVAKMSQAAELLRGRHDFSSFSERDEKRDQSPIVVVDKAAITAESTLMLFEITASHFLWKMVRRLVGTIVEVGRGGATFDEFSALLNKPRLKNRINPARLTAPPSGLFLERITYATPKFK